MSFEAGLIVQELFPITSAFFIVDNASASGSSNTIYLTSRIFLESHIVGYLAEAVPAQVNVVFPDKTLLSAASLAFVCAPSKALSGLNHYITSTEYLSLKKATVSSFVIL